MQGQHACKNYETNKCETGRENECVDVNKMLRDVTNLLSFYGHFCYALSSLLKPASVSIHPNLTQPKLFDFAKITSTLSFTLTSYFYYFLWLLFYIFQLLFWLIFQMAAMPFPCNGHSYLPISNFYGYTPAFSRLIVTSNECIALNVQILEISAR